MRPDSVRRAWNGRSKNNGVASESSRLLSAHNSIKSLLFKKRYTETSRSLIFSFPPSTPLAKRLRMWVSFAFRNMFGPLGQGLGGFLSTTWLIIRDTLMTLINPILPRKRIGAVWHEYIPPTPTDSRCPCPALNALCNHGVLPRDGKNITFNQLAKAVHSHYNFSTTFCSFVCVDISTSLRKELSDAVDLSAIGTHNCIEHDGSLFRRDIHFQPDQGTPSIDLIEDFLSTTKDSKTVAPADLSRAITHRFKHSARNNPQFSLTGLQLFFAAANASTLLRIFGGDAVALRTILLEERIPDGWTTSNKTRFGLTMGSFNPTVFRVLLGIDPSWKKVKYEGSN